ncbi:hypothetical protein ELI_2425 [Eubacterium callanderi]|uniref:Uncharacterized protein n=1 Tax=Eubacterium callanderi TaxID=53442 RepID=E3GN30_9FIRM|nr:hypothetical protein ELI_2425 [Eubacterium callanderi]
MATMRKNKLAFILFVQSWNALKSTTIFIHHFNLKKPPVL